MLLAALSLLAATEQRRIPAADAQQGVAADAAHVYAIDNRAIAKIDKRSGRVVARWEGSPERFRHLNSCIVRGPDLVCAHSNYPLTPHRSEVVRVDRATMRLRDVRPLGGEGSLTWLDRHQGAWWACFANYDGKGGEPGRDHRATVLVRYTDDFRAVARWRFPAAVLDRFAPRSSSGGAWGRDGLLYVTGHDRPELYALRVPAKGDTLTLVATLTTPTGGQAIGWDPVAARTLWSIDRATTALVASRVPAVAR